MIAVTNCGWHRSRLKLIRHTCNALASSYEEAYATPSRT